jgi:hypothetical protein
MILEWVHIHETAFWWIGTLSIAAFVGTLIAIPILVVHIPADYFKRKRQKPGRSHGQHSAIRLLGLVLKNFLGIVFVLAGFAMLLLPGQGFVTILIGMMMVNFPGKVTLERRIVQHPTVLRAINWMRAKAKKPAIEAPKLGLTVGGDNGESVDFHL